MMGRRVRHALGAVAGAMMLAVIGALPAAAAPTCTGDCNGDGVVRVPELVTLVNVALGKVDLSVCVAGDVNGDGVIKIDELVLAVRSALGECASAAICTGTTYTYTFTNYCGAAIYIGQNGPGTSSTPPSAPTTDNWAVAGACTTANQASVCTPGNTCQVPTGQNIGQCSCATDDDCGGAPCLSSGVCSTSITFCMPQDWSSGVFWPRTGCELSPSGDHLNCATGQCGGDTTSLSDGRIDCGSSGASGGQNGPTAPAIRFEPTTTSGGVLNYDVSVINGFNVEMSVTVTGGSGCPVAGCTGDLVANCPGNLVYGNPWQAQAMQTPTPVGCYQPQDACNSSGAGPAQTPPARLNCTETITTDSLGNTPVTTTDCSGNSGDAVTYLDMYEAENTADSQMNTQISANSGTITAFSPDDCPPGTEYTAQFVASGTCMTDADCTTAGQSCNSNMQCAVVAPAGAGMCLQFVGGVLVPDYGCSAGNIGTACGQYVTQGFGDGLGYTCQAVTYSGGTAYPCVPPTLSGLGTCTVSGGLGYYDAVGGPFNPSWVEAGIQAGGGTPYYETFKTLCPGAYSFQYDDKSSDYGCNITASSSNGFAITFCGSALTPSPNGPTATATPTPTATSPAPAATGTATNTPTAAEPTATSTVQELTATATSTAPDATPTATDTPVGPQSTATATPSGAALTWNLDGMVLTNLEVGLSGESFPAGALTLNDSQSRFCPTPGMEPVVKVVFGPDDTAVIGYSNPSTSQLTIASIPGATTPGTYDVQILTFENCGSTQTTLTMPAALTYLGAEATSTATSTPTIAAATATATATDTATVSQTTATATATATASSGGLSWDFAGTVMANFEVDLGGQSFLAGVLTLDDSQSRFCATPGMEPLVSVVFGPGNTAVIGYTNPSAAQLTIANIPAAGATGTYDVQIVTFVNCSTQTTLTMPGALTYISPG